MLRLVDVPRGGLLLHRDERRGLPIVHLPIPELVAETIEMGDGQPMKGQPNKIRGTPRTATRRCFACVHHVVQRRNGGHVGSDLRDNEPGASDTDPLADQAPRLDSFLRGNQVEGTQLVLWPPAAPVAQGRHPAQHVLFGGDWHSHQHPSFSGRPGKAPHAVGCATTIVRGFLGDCCKRTSPVVVPGGVGLAIASPAGGRSVSHLRRNWSGHHLREPLHTRPYPPLPSSNCTRIPSGSQKNTVRTRPD